MNNAQTVWLIAAVDLEMATAHFVSRTIGLVCNRLTSSQTSGQGDSYLINLRRKYFS